jgi:hypothetical protein
MAPKTNVFGLGAASDRVEPLASQSDLPQVVLHLKPLKPTTPHLGQCDQATNQNSAKEQGCESWDCYGEFIHGRTSVIRIVSRNPLEVPDGTSMYLLDTPDNRGGVVAGWVGGVGSRCTTHI